MPKIELLNQPFDDTLDNRLLDLILSGRFDKINILVAFARIRGVEILQDAISEFKSGGGTVDVYVGFDLEGTSFEALTALQALADNLYLLHSSAQQTFHPKIYNLCGEREAVLIVGSNNLTTGGLQANVESSVVALLSLDENEDLAVQASVERFLADLSKDGSTCMRIESKSDLEQLLEVGVIPNEAAIRENRKFDPLSPSKEGNRRYFPGQFAARDDAQKKHEARRASQALERDAAGAEWGTFWIETGKGTGGSNNQLDLSTIAFVAPGDPGNEKGTEKRQIDGNVCFFGVDPSAKDTTYSVSIQFRGKVYIGNKISIKSEGDGKNPNGSWRLYLCGSCGDEKLPAAVGAVGIRGKIASFSRLDGGAYSLELLPLERLSDLMERSEVVARGGTSYRNRRFGFVR